MTGLRRVGSPGYRASTEDSGRGCHPGKGRWHPPLPQSWLIGEAAKGVGVLLSGVGDGGTNLSSFAILLCVLECHQHSRAFQHSLGLISSPEPRPRWPLLGVLSRFQRKEAPHEATDLLPLPLGRDPPTPSSQVRLRAS